MEPTTVVSSGVCLCTICLLLGGNPMVLIGAFLLICLTCIVVMVHIIAGCWKRSKRIDAMETRRRNRGIAN